MHLLYTTAIILSLCADSGVLGVAVKGKPNLIDLETYAKLT